MKNVLFGLVICAAQPVLADASEITNATAVQTASGWRFNVTVTHPDTGWDHYADGWAVEDAAGNQLGLRVLGHPHVDEQPFTRSLGGVAISDGTNQVFLRTRCSVDGWSEQTFEVTIK